MFHNVDRTNGVVDVILKFGAPLKSDACIDHKTPYVTVGASRRAQVYRPDGTLKEIRPSGSYVTGVADGEPHTEGGGDEAAIVFFSNRNVKDELYEFLDENMRPVFTLRIGDFEDQLAAQGTPKWKDCKLIGR